MLKLNAKNPKDFITLETLTCSLQPYQSEVEKSVKTNDCFWPKPDAFG